MIRIYGVPVSVHTRKPLVVARLKGIAVESVPVIPFDPPADWRTLSPTGLIPAMVDGDLSLTDSTSICAYLDRLSPKPPIYGEGARGFAQSLAVEHYAGTLFQRVVQPLFFQTVVRPRILQQGPADEAVVRQVLDKDAPEIFAVLEGWLAGGAMGAGALLIGEITVASNLVNFRYLGFSIEDTRFPRLAAFFRSIAATRVFRDQLEAEKPFAERMGLDRGFIAAL